jgi:hypothetical protein
MVAAAKVLTATVAAAVEVESAALVAATVAGDGSSSISSNGSSII